jgi:hypothetical protein
MAQGVNRIAPCHLGMRCFLSKGGFPESSDPEYRVTINAHLIVALTSSFLGFAAGFFGLGFCVLVIIEDVPRLAQAAVMFSCGVASFWVVKVIFTKVVSARCPSCRRGAVFPVGTWVAPIVYLCSNCGYREEKQAGLSNDV